MTQFVAFLLSTTICKVKKLYYPLYNSSFWSSNLIGWEECNILVITELQPFTICITLLVVFLTASVVADAQIHYNFINNTVFVSRNVVLRVF